jgi:peptidoglycan hydrolase-like protein with peptidoglycan-binding domain
MRRIILPICLIAGVMFSATASADKLTEIIQSDLAALGYEPGNVSGEMTTETIVAISRFQAENDMTVTGEASPQLAGIIKAKLRAQAGSAGASSAPAAAVASPARDPAALQAAQQACLEDKIAKAQDAQKKKRGLGSLMRAAGRTASRFGGDVGRVLGQTSRDIYDANATLADLESAARDLGIANSEIDECRNPPM